ncbi:MAG: hypothetical protein GXO74_08150 [Calditrichaeota bacterium]|nr:hypothetical protein [Calditrichota bacterium]
MIKKANQALSAVLFITFIFFLSTANAQQAPVAQDVGLLDVEYSSLTKQVCQDCHGTSLADTHHETQIAQSGQCVTCHSVSTTPGQMGVVLQRDCMKCHTETPHHKTEAALNNECTNCHDSPGLNDYSTSVATYPVSMVTPAVANCKKCHDNGEAAGLQVVDFKETHHGISIDNCDICHEGTETKTTNIRICERCHNQEVIHQVAPHIEAQNCVVCHLTKK